MNFGSVMTTGLIAAFLVAGMVEAARFSPREVRARSLFLGSLALRTLGAFAFFGPSAASLGLVPFVNERTEFPTGRPDALLRDSLGNQFVTLVSAERIQVYDARGNFVRGWFVDADGGAFAIEFTRAGLIAVRAARREGVVFYSVDGARQRDVSPADGQALYPATGSPRVRFGYPWWEWPLSGPFPAFCVLTLGTFGAARYRRKRAGVAAGGT